MPITMQRGKIMSRVWGERNLLKIFLSNKNVSLQVVNTVSGHIYLHASTLERRLKHVLPNTADSKAAHEAALLLAERAHEAGKVQMTWERHRQRYLGKTKVVIDTLREQGIQFVSRADCRAARDLGEQLQPSQPSDERS